MRINNYFKLFAIACVLPILGALNVDAQCLTSTGPTNDCSYGDAIDAMTINGVTVSNSGCSGTGTGYTFFPTPIWNFTLGSSYPISLTVGGATYDQGVRIWIDLNNNGQFEATESVFASATPALSHTGTLTLPSTGAAATVRMRVMCTYNTTATAGDACTSNVGNYGETEDYDVILSPFVVPGHDASAAMIMAPADNSCGNASDSIWVQINNTGNDTLTNLPVQTSLSGLASGMYPDTVALLNPGDSIILFVAAINTVAGGQLDIELVTQDTADINTANDTLMVSTGFYSSEPLIVTGDTEICFGQLATLNVNVLQGEDYTWYQDSVGGTMILTADSLMVGPLTADSTFAVASSNTCRMSAMQTITVLPLVAVSYSYVASYDTVSFTSNVANANSIMWDFGNGNTSTQANPTEIFGTPGTFVVCLTAYGLCDTSTVCDTIVTSIFVGIKGRENAQIALYPNPADEVLFISLDGLEGLKGDWKITDLQGKVVLRNTLEVQGMHQELQVNLNGLASGAYLFDLSTEGQSISKKFVKR